MIHAPPHPDFLSQVHCEQRALERYGREMSDDDTADMARQIRDGRGVFIRRKDSRTTLWLVWWPSVQRIVPVYYSTKRKIILTILPMGAINS